MRLLNCPCSSECPLIQHVGTFIQPGGTYMICSWMPIMHHPLKKHRHSLRWLSCHISRHLQCIQLTRASSDSLSFNASASSLSWLAHAFTHTGAASSLLHPCSTASDLHPCMHYFMHASTGELIKFFLMRDVCVQVHSVFFTLVPSPFALSGFFRLFSLLSSALLRISLTPLSPLPFPSPLE